MKEIKVCLYCKKTFQSFPSQKRKFCSSHCRHCASKSRPAWNKGLKNYLSDETREKMRQAKFKGSPSVAPTRKRLHNWTWVKLTAEIKERDNYTCQICGKRNCRLNVHHCVPYSESKDNSANNLVTLCCACHSWAESKKDLAEDYKKYLRGF